MPCQFATKWQPFIYITPSAVLVLLWNYLMYAHCFLFIHFTGGFTTEVAPATWYKFGFVIMGCCGCFFFSISWSVS